MKLTNTTIRSLALPAGVTEKTFFDDELAGFGVRVRASGSRTYVCQYKIHGRNRRLPLGKVTAIELGKARSTAKDLLAAVRLGRDPVGEKLEQRQEILVAFDVLLPRFLARQRSRLKPRSYVETERHLLVQAEALHALPVEKIDRRTVALRLHEIAERNGPAAANRARTSLSAYFTWLAREGYVDANPVAYTNKAIENGARSRVLSDDELATVWRALGDDQYGAIVKLLILTGARRDEIGGLRWSEIDLERALITLPPERTKNRREHQIPLSAPVLAILQAQPRRFNPDGSQRDFVFGRGQGWQKWSASKAELDARIHTASAEPIADWRLHDCRRVLSTGLHELGVMPHVVAACLGHAGSHSGVSGVYNWAGFFELRRCALESWAGHVAPLVSGERSPTVVPLRGRRL